ncbi:MAG: CCA tRNA nucleotidyltransferase [Candidatus Pacebacteria bacterium]|nr:CCA tRNA nucleotidyltransferase [Candidatus Paceibacterota bacterium]
MKTHKKPFKQPIPREVSRVTQTLEEANFEAYLIGGCVRDMLVEKKPKDWDITTNATPEQIIELFEKTFYENDYGTVGVVNEDTKHEEMKVIEVTPYRLESDYSDNRRPDSVKWSDNLEDDLKRRDFAMNAIAYSVSRETLIDPYNGTKDIQDKIIRTVGDPHDRFREDSLRILRAVRLATELGFTINTSTQEAIKQTAHTLKNIAVERIRDELTKIVMSDSPMLGLIMAHELDVLKHVLPEIERGIGVEQNGDHIYTVWEHNLRAVQHAAKRDFSLDVRLAALLHDISKPETRRWSKEKNNWTFYGHDVVGAKVTRETLKRLKFPKKTTTTVIKLVRNHLFFSDIEKISLSAVRRIVRNVGPENVWKLMDVRVCDRIGMGRPKETPYRLRKYESMIEEAMRAPVSVQMLKIDGARIMEITKEKPGRKIGYILHALLEETVYSPENNNEMFLVKRALELSVLPEKDLVNLAEKGKKEKEKKEEEELAEIRKRYHVK